MLFRQQSELWGKLGHSIPCMNYPGVLILGEERAEPMSSYSGIEILSEIQQGKEYEWYSII